VASLPAVPPPAADDVSGGSSSCARAGAASLAAVQRILGASDDNVLLLTGSGEDAALQAYLREAQAVDPRREGGSAPAFERVQGAYARAIGRPLPPTPWTNCNMVLHMRALTGRQRTALLSLVEAARAFGERVFEPPTLQALLAIGQSEYLVLGDADVYRDIARRIIVETTTLEALQHAEQRLEQAVEAADGTAPSNQDRAPELHSPKQLLHARYF